MKTITAAEIKAEVAAREGCAVDCVECYNCQYWGYNCGKSLNSVGESRCTARTKKTNTWARQYCRKFKMVEKKVKKRD